MEVRLLSERHFFGGGDGGGWEGSSTGAAAGFCEKLVAASGPLVHPRRLLGGVERAEPHPNAPPRVADVGRVLAPRPPPDTPELARTAIVVAASGHETRRIRSLLSLPSGRVLSGSLGAVLETNLLDISADAWALGLVVGISGVAVVAVVAEDSDGARPSGLTLPVPTAQREGLGGYLDVLRAPCA